MGLFTKGNTKIHESVLCFSLPPIKTCPNHEHCASCCYAAVPYRMYPSTKAKWDANYYTTQNTDQFVRLAISELTAAEAKGHEVTRIHVSGDFYSQEYVDAWHEVIEHMHNMMFYTYTKAMEHFMLAHLIIKENINIIDSIAHDGLPNFGPPLRVYELQQQGYHICPASNPANKDKLVCGLECTHCHIKGNEKVAFYKH